MWIALLTFMYCEHSKRDKCKNNIILCFNYFPILKLISKDKSCLYLRSMIAFKNEWQTYGYKPFNVNIEIEDVKTCKKGYTVL